MAFTPQSKGIPKRRSVVSVDMIALILNCLNITIIELFFYWCKMSITHNP